VLEALENQMRRLYVLRIICTVVFCVFALQAQSPQPKWQSGTITAVRPHAGAENNPDGNQYEVSVRVENTVYVALYTPPPGSRTAQYRAGTSLQVLIEGETLTFNDLLGRANKLPVLRREAIREEKSQ
jgi:hypothetical protein